MAIRTKNSFIKELIITAQDSIWKNEMALEYTKIYGEGTEQEKELKIKSCEHAIKKDKEYIEFLKSKLSKVK